MVIRNNWNTVREFINTKQNILITTHVNPDGDAIGSQMALYHYLSGLDKNVYLLNCDKTPAFFNFLDPDQKIVKYDPKEHTSIIENLDGVIVVDISDWARLFEVGEAIQQCNIPVACIDHHIPTDTMGPVQVSDQLASSTGEMLYEFLLDSHVEMSIPIVNALYTCILTDTGSFRFSNTTSVTHRVAADLLELGAEFKKIYRYVFESNSQNRSVLKGHLLANMHFECSGKLAWFVLSDQLLRDTGAELWEAEGFSELPRSIEGVEISLMFIEKSLNKTKVSFRSKGQISINGLAGKFGGGGHKFASGAMLSLGVSEAIKAVVQDAMKLIEEGEKP